MKKINKACNLSSEYHAWQKQFEDSKENHPKYTSSNGKYYYDIIMNLFHCQKGLCAYTEVILCTENFFSDVNWSENRYTLPNNTIPTFSGQLDHFDPTLKENKAWLWDNFFMVDPTVNAKSKNSKNVDPILKPDSPDYDEFTLLEYNTKLHVFVAKTTLPDVKQAKINEMILILGINHDPIRYQRSIYLRLLSDPVQKGLETWDNIVIEQFPTAVEMLKRQSIN